MINFSLNTGVSLQQLTYIRSIKLALDNGSGFIEYKVITDFAGTINADAITTITDSGNSTNYYNDASSTGELGYATFTVDFLWLNDSSTHSISSISLCSDTSGDTLIATSNTSLGFTEIKLTSGTSYHIKLTGKFVDNTDAGDNVTLGKQIAAYLRFENIIASPRHATEFREGLVRFVTSGANDNQKASSVYTAETVDTLISTATKDSIHVENVTIVENGQANNVSASGVQYQYSSTDGAIITFNAGATEKVTISGELSANSYTGAGVQSSTTNWDAAANNSKIPTIEIVSTVANDLQEQIDALNAGQNLADIVKTLQDLITQDLTNLKAKNDTLNNSDTTLISVGDKVQVLVDDYNGGVPTVYELVKGTLPTGVTLTELGIAYSITDDGTKHVYVSSATSGYYWEYIGPYGASSTAASNIKNEQLEVGAIGLFMYSEVGDEKSIGSSVSGSYLTPVGMSLPFSGEIQYKMSGSAQSGTFRIMSVAFKRTSLSPCLVLAQKISED